jgi:hypothetical protein
MRRYLWLLLFAAVAFVPAPAFAVDELLVSFEGYDYEDPDGDPGTFGTAGDWYNAIGFVQAGHPLLGLDLINDQNTFQFAGLWSTGYVDFGPFRFISYSPGRVRVFSDPIGGVSAGDFNGSAFADNDCAVGAPPPNDTAPSTFIDGTLRLGGIVSGFVISWDFGSIPGSGSFSGTVAFDEGTELGNVPPLVSAYTFAGLTEGAVACVRPGYDHQVSGSIRIERSTSTENSTWGRMKALYR